MEKKNNKNNKNKNNKKKENKAINPYEDLQNYKLDENIDQIINDINDDLIDNEIVKLKSNQLQEKYY